MEKRRREGPRMMRASAVAAGGFLLLVGVVILLVSVNSRTELLDGPASGLPTNAGTPRSAMPSSWLSSGDEKSSPLLQDSSDNAVQVLATPGAAVQPAHDMSLAARDPPTALQPEAPAPAAASASAATGSSNKLGAVATALSGQIASLPKPPAVSVAHHLAAAPKADARVGLHAAPKKHLQWEQAQNPDSWKNMVRKAEEAASALAKQHPRSVLGAHWREAVSGQSETLQEDSVAAAKAGKAAQDQLVQLAKDHLKQKGIYAPAAMCQEDNLPCPGTLRSQETSTGHYAPVRDNGPAPGEQMKSVQKKEKKLVMPAPARYPAVSFYAKVREEMSSAEKARLSAEPSHKTALEMLAPGEHEHRPNRGVEEHREREERRDDEKRREEDTLRREQSHEKSLHELHAEERREEARKVDTDHSIGNHLYKLFIAHSGGSNRRDERQLESETRPSADELKNRDSIRSVEGSKLYEDKMSDDDEEDPEEEERQKKMRGELRVKQAQERMAAQWRDTMAHPPRRSARTRPDMLDPRELHVPRVGFKAKKKELDNFKAAIEMYEADPEMNPMTIVQAHVLAKYGIMPPESDSARDWQAWYRETTDKAQILSDQVAMLASPLVDAPHRWDHGRPDDWCGSGGCRTLAHEKRGDRYVAKSPAPDRLEKALRGKMTSAVLSGVDAGGRLPTEVTISADPARQDEGEEYHRRLPVVRARDDDDARDDGYRTSDDWRDDRGPRKHEAYRWHDDEEELRDYQRDYERDHESQRSDRGYEERDRPVRYDHVAPREETAPVKQLYGKVDQLQDEVSHLVKMLSRRQLAQTAEERGDVRNERADDEARERQHARRAPESEAFREHAGVVRMGNTERHDAHAEKARLAASHVIDWLRGAILAAKV